MLRTSEKEIANKQEWGRCSHRFNGPFAACGHMVQNRHAGEQPVHWDIQNKATSSSQIYIFFVLDVPVRSLLSSMVDFVPCNCLLQRAHFQLLYLYVVLPIIQEPATSLSYLPTPQKPDTGPNTVTDSNVGFG